ncbi:MAG: precorrin-6A synthase (deacetylating) [Chloroflexi bacterium]|nr:precorrin-6A synthase (deacetylating) [Chloroflexota bacterium]
MRKVLVIGIGAGNIEHVTVQAINALNRVDVFFITDKGSTTADLVELRQQICARYIARTTYRFVEIADAARDRTAGGAAYRASVEAWHQQRLERYEQALGTELEDDQCGAFLVWGDPSLYDSTLRVLDQIRARGQVQFEHEVIPGISSVQALAAQQRSVLHGIGEPLLITTGRRLADDWQLGLPNTVVMLDGHCAFRELDPTDVDIVWGANIGLADEVGIAGDLESVAASIQSIRAETRAKRGWIMDTYLLRRKRAD